jgi:hypothetical protein
VTSACREPAGGERIGRAGRVAEQDGAGREARPRAARDGCAAGDVRERRRVVEQLAEARFARDPARKRGARVAAELRPVGERGDEHLAIRQRRDVELVTGADEESRGAPARAGQRRAGSAPARRRGAIGARAAVEMEGPAHARGDAVGADDEAPRA